MKTDFYKNNIKYYLGANIIIISLLVIFSFLLLIVPHRIPDSGNLTIKIMILAAISLTVLVIINSIKTKVLRAILQSSFVILFFGYFYGFSSNFQMIIHDKWQDDKIVALDRTLFGGEVSLLAEKIVSPYLTEVMMFSYVFYFPLLFLVAIIAYRSASEKGLGEYLSILSLGIGFCHLGFILFPVASQMHYLPGQYSVILQGGWFTYLGELLRSHAHFAGGSLPSPHCAAATIMLIVLYKNNRVAFYLILPIALFLYASTVYCRYHYIWDGVIGILSAIILVKLFPFFQKGIEMLLLIGKYIIHPVSISQSLSD
jgi:hypothetical protein